MGFSKGFSRDARGALGARTFSGGLGFRRPVVVLDSGTSYTLTGDQSGVLVVLNDAFSSGIQINMPADTAANIGFTCTIVIAVDQTGTFKIATAANGDIIYGAIRTQTLTSSNHGAKDEAFQGGGSFDNLIFNADVEGRMAGSVYHVTIAASNVLFVEGHGIRTGQTPTTPWSTS